MTIKALLIIVVALLSVAWGALLSLALIRRKLLPPEPPLRQTLDGLELACGFLWLCAATIWAILA
jgi:hypothetical protein